MKLRIMGIKANCIPCGRPAKWLVLNFPMCDECANGRTKAAQRSHGGNDQQDQKERSS